MPRLRSYRFACLVVLLAAGGGLALAQSGIPKDRPLVELEDTVRRESENADAHRRLGLALHGDGQLRRAIESYERAIRLAPDVVESYLGLSDVYEAANLRAEAESLLTDTAAAFPASVAVRVELGETRFLAGKLREALEDFQRARRMADADGTVREDQKAFILRRIGDMHVHMIRFDEALAAYRNAVELAPGDLDVRLALGKLHLRRNRLDGALREYSLVVERDPGRLEGHEGVAEATFRLGRFDDAAAAAEAAIRIDPARLGPRYRLAAARLRTGPDDAARAAMDAYRELEAEARAREQREREIGSVQKAALAEALDGNPERAVVLLRDGIAAHPRAEVLHLNLGATLGSLERYADAAAVFEDMLDSGIGDSEQIRRLLDEARLAGAAR